MGDNLPRFYVSYDVIWGCKEKVYCVIDRERESVHTGGKFITLSASNSRRVCDNLNELQDKVNDLKKQLASIA